MTRWLTIGVLGGLAAWTFPAMADAALKGTCLLAVVLAAEMALRRRSAAVRHLLLMASFGLLLALPVLTLILPGWQVLPEWLHVPAVEEPPESDSRAAPAVLDSAATAPIRVVDGFNHEANFNGTRTDRLPATSAPFIETEWSEPPAISAGPATVIETADEPPITSSGVLTSTARNLCVLAWLAGAALLLLRLAFGAGLLWRARRRATLITDGPLYQLLQGLRGELALRRPVRLYLGSNRAMPMAWGLWRACILVPGGIETWAPSQQRAVLLHELGHVVRRDPLWQLIVELARALYWFHPLVWLAAWRVHVEREQACDDLVISRGVAAQDYARHLLDVVSRGRLRTVRPAIGVAMASTHKLEGRVRSILDERRNRRPVTRTVAVVGLLACVAIGLPLAMMRAGAETSAPGDEPPVEVEVNGPIQLPYGAAVRLGSPRFMLGDGHVRFLPDGSVLVGVSSRHSGINYGRGARVAAVVNAETGEVSRWIGPETDSQVDVYVAGVSQDGSRIVFTRSSRLAIEQDTSHQSEHVLDVYNVATGELVATLDIPGFVLWGGEGCLAISRDGRLLTVADRGFGADRSIQVWDVVTGHQLARASIPARDAVDELEFSADGKQVLAMSAGGSRWTRPSLLAWDWGTTDELTELPAGASTLSFSNDGERLAITLGSTWIWDVATWLEWPGETGFALARVPINEIPSRLLFSPDASTLAVVTSSTRQLLLINVADGSVLRHVDTEGMSPVDVAFSPDGSRLAAVGDPGLKIWDVDTGLAVDGERKSHLGAARFLTYSRDGTRVASAGQDGMLAVWAADDGRLICKLDCGSSHTDIDFAPNGRDVVATNEENEITVWNGETGALLRTLEDPPELSFRSQIEITERGDTVSCGADGLVLTHAFDSGELTADLDLRPDPSRISDQLQQLYQIFWRKDATPAFQSALSADGTTVALSPTNWNDDAALKVYEVATGRLIRSLPEFPDGDGLIYPGADHRTPNGLALSPDGGLLFWSADIIDVETGETVVSIDDFQGRSIAAAFSADGRSAGLLANTNDNSTVWIVDVATRTVRRVLDLPVGGSALAFSPDGEQITVAFTDNSILTWNVAAFQTVANADPESSAATLQPASPEQVTRRVRELLYILRQFRVFSRSDEWGGAMRELIEIGKPAVPELVAELDRTDRDETLSAIGFVLRGIGDPRAVPALIRNFPKLLRAPRSDYGIHIHDPELRAFLNQHERYPDDDSSVTFGRPVNEILDTLQKLTGHSEPPDGQDDPLRHVTLGGGREQRARAREAYAARQTRWEQWWSGHQDDFVTAETLRSLELPPRDGDAVAEAGLARFGPLFSTGPDVRLGPVREVELDSRVYWDAPSHFDFDTGRVFQYLEGAEQLEPETPGDTFSIVVNWPPAMGIDIRGNDGMDLHGWQIDNERWDTIEDEVRRDEPLPLGPEATDWLVRFDGQRANFQYDQVGTFLFTTREGGRGIVQSHPRDVLTGKVKLRYRMWIDEQHPESLPPHARTRDTTGPKFGEAVTLKLQTPGRGKTFLLDLDTGQAVTPPDSIVPADATPEFWYSDSEPFAEWCREKGIDLATRLTQYESGTTELKQAISLVGLQMVERNLLPDAFDTMTVPEAWEILHRLPETSEYAWISPTADIAHQPDTFVIRTRTGRMALLRIWESAEDGSSITIHYRLGPDPQDRAGADAGSVIRGRVLDSNQQPIAAAGVWLPVDLMRDERTVHTTTDAEGRFELTVPAAWWNEAKFPGYTVWVQHDAYSLGMASAWAQFQRYTDEVTITLDRPTEGAVFEVLHPDGTPAADAQVAPLDVKSPGGDYHPVPVELRDKLQRTADAQGRVTFEAVPRELLNSVQVDADGFGRQVLHLGLEGYEERERRIVLGAAGRIEGRVETDDPALLDGLTLYFETRDPGWLDPFWTSGDEDEIERRLNAGDHPRRTRGTAVVRVGADGRFVVPAIADGRLVMNSSLDVTASHGVRLRDIVVDVAAGRTQQIAINAAPRVTVRGRVVRQGSGEPVPNAIVSVDDGEDGDELVATDGKGQFTCTVLAGRVDVSVDFVRDEPDGWRQISESQVVVEPPGGDRLVTLPDVVIAQADDVATSAADAQGNSSDAFVETTPLQHQVSLTGDDMPLKDALVEICRQAGISLEFDMAALADTQLDLDQPVTVEMHDKPLFEALWMLIDGRAHPGVVPRIQSGGMRLTTLAARQEWTREHLPDWFRPLYQKGAWATLNEEGEIVEVHIGSIATDDLLARLTTLPELRALEIGSTTGITRAGLAHLAELPKLERLDLDGVNQESGLGDAAIESILGLEKLRELRISECGTTDAGVKRLQSLPQLTHLTLRQEARLTDAALASIAKIEALKHLDLTSRVSADGEMRFSPPALNQLSALTNLEVLLLPGHAIEGPGFAFPRLRSLSVGGDRVDDAFASAVTECPRLELLLLDRTRVSDAGLGRIATLPELRSLRIRGGNITDVGISRLAGASRIEHVELRELPLTDEVLDQLARIETLTQVDLALSDQFNILDLQRLSALPRLRTLSLWLPPPDLWISDSPEERRQRETAAVAALQPDIDTLQEALPDTRINLGIGGRVVGPWAASLQPPGGAESDEQSAAPGGHGADFGSLSIDYDVFGGNAEVYVDTITTVYEREVRVDRGRNYPEVLDEELKQAWAREQGVPLRHNSLVHYPNAVISVSDERTGERFYVESNGTKVFALNSDGATVRIIDVVRATDLEHLVGAPVVRHLELRGPKLLATVGKHTVVTIDRASGEIESVVSD